MGALALGGCATPPEEDPVYIRMNDLDARVQRIERVLTNQSLLELAQRLDALQADVRTIRGEVELLQNETEGGKTQSRNLYGDLEKRLAALETLGGVGAAPCRRRDAGRRWRAPPSRQPTTPAMAALRGGNYDKAIATFREVVTNYPDRRPGEPTRSSGSARVTTPRAISKAPSRPIARCWPTGRTRARRPTRW